MVTNKQPDDPSASPFLTRVKKQSSAMSDARCDDGGTSWGQKVRPGRRTQEAPTNLETPTVILFDILFALARSI